MFLPEYEAIEFIKRMEGGSTLPWQIRVRRKDDTTASFVVKLYQENKVEDGVLLKECLSSYLAKEFYMSTPEVALIRFGDDFLGTLHPQNCDFLHQRDHKIKFATLLIQDPYVNYSPLIHEELIDEFDMAIVYAFDNLVQNFDRKPDKPNLLVRNSELILIDHEYTFGESPIACINSKADWHYPYQKHIFHETVKKMSPKTRFDTFHECLSRMNIPAFEKQVDQLMEHEHNVARYYSHINPYLCAVRNHPDRFIDILNRTLL